jgi:hypothetical protein
MSYRNVSVRADGQLIPAVRVVGPGSGQTRHTRNRFLIKLLQNPRDHIDNEMAIQQKPVVIGESAENPVVPKMAANGTERSWEAAQVVYRFHDNSRCLTESQVLIVVVLGLRCRHDSDHHLRHS